MTGREGVLIGVGCISEAVQPKAEDFFVLRGEGHVIFGGFDHFRGSLEGVFGAKLFLGSLLLSSFLPAALEKSAMGCPLHKVIINLIVIKSSEHHHPVQRSYGMVEWKAPFGYGWGGFLCEEMMNIRDIFRLEQFNNSYKRTIRIDEINLLKVS